MSSAKELQHFSNIHSLQVVSLEFKGDDGKLHGETSRRLHGWAQPVGKGGLRGGGLLDGCAKVEERRCGDKDMREEMSNIIEEIILRIIASKEGVKGADKEFRCEELPELVVLGQPGKGWKEVADEVLLSQV